MVEIPKRGGVGGGGGPTFGKNSQKIPHFFPEAFPYYAWVGTANVVLLQLIDTDKQPTISLMTDNSMFILALLLYVNAST